MNLIFIGYGSIGKRHVGKFFKFKQIRPENLADSVLFLASDATSNIIEEVLMVDGNERR
jgi:NAD(P)-dependent dehydrogenase (short-subunit alcohol dehydrogenase family)